MIVNPFFVLKENTFLQILQTKTIFCFEVYLILFFHFFFKKAIPLGGMYIKVQFSQISFEISVKNTVQNQKK